MQIISLANQLHYFRMAAQVVDYCCQLEKENRIEEVLNLRMYRYQRRSLSPVLALSFAQSGSKISDKVRKHYKFQMEHGHHLKQAVEFFHNPPMALEAQSEASSCEIVLPIRNLWTLALLPSKTFKNFPEIAVRVVVPEAVTTRCSHNFYGRLNRRIMTLQLYVPDHAQFEIMHQEIAELMPSFGQTLAYKGPHSL